MKKIPIVALACALMGLAAPAFAASPATAATHDADAQAAAAKAARMQWFADAKFGIFIHWGIYSVDGITESWSFFDGYVSYPDYMKQAKGFTASHYDPQAWADLIKASGAKYAVLTSKHHDGMALWDTKQGLNVVKDTPAHRDLVAPFVKALRKDGLKVGLYFSLIDWSSPFYPAFTQDQTRYRIKDDPARWDRFVTYYQDQVHDLTRRFHPDLYWFDGDWEHSAAEWHSKTLHDWIMAHDPDAIINGRLPGYGDYGTPEQGVPIMRPPYKYWELCLTMNNSWGWQPNDDHFKTPYEIIRILSDTLDMGGNLLLDIGPRADGTIPKIEADTLRQVGRWVHENQEAIYGSDAGIPHDYYLGDSTLSKDHKTLYLFIDGKPNGAILLKGLTNRVLRARVVGNGTILNPQRLGATLGGAPSMLAIDVPDYTLDPDVTVIALELDGPIKLFHPETKSETN
ncbi:MAG: alpha-L-fucosidase [Rhodanobacteraceae bacterium]|jgi:alpha-L-fucosidase|nr:MAG: alpha-L-fucosidase [Rhodanobacteraceae bacterium]